MTLSLEKIKELLVKPGHIAEVDFDTAAKEAAKLKQPVEEVLTRKNLIQDEQLGLLLAEEIGVPFLNLRNEKISEEMLRVIPELVAKSKGIIALSATPEGLRIGMINPRDLEIIHFLEKRTGQKVIPYMVMRSALAEALSGYQAGLTEQFQEVLRRLQNTELPREERDEAAVEMVDTLLEYGNRNKASDIHIEPYEKKIGVRFRIDGVMHDVLDIPKEVADLILTRIKILGKMRTDEHRAAQDGKLRFKAKEETIDVRISVVPVTQGENVVMRLLSSQNRQYYLPDLGFAEEDFKKVKRAIKKPHGMILVTGPTGSGKTTTLYAILKILNKRDIHIATIEDPVEYDVEGISQIQVNTRTNLTFAKGLRALVRQDPDIIMVGEIRDEETADIAVNSAMTGHLVLSTLHANDAATTLPRLLDMGIEPFLVASTVNVIIAQRLVRKIHENCRVSYEFSKGEQETLEDEPEIKRFLKEKGYGEQRKITAFRGNGCKVCGGTGYLGRIGIFEILEMTEPIKQLILKRASSDEIMAQARQEGTTTMLENGMEKVINGVTTLEEILRVTKS